MEIVGPRQQMNIDRLDDAKGAHHVENGWMEWYAFGLTVKIE